MSGLYLGFDWGRRRLGGAAGPTVTGSASPIETLAADQGRPDWDRLDTIIGEWDPVALIVGLPVHMDGTEQAETRSARAFAQALAQRYGLPVHEADERLSSREATGLLVQARQRGRRRQSRKGEIDRMAATLILERWLAHHGDN